MECGLECQCKECKKLKKFLRDQEKSGKIHLAGTEEDLKKIRCKK